MKRLIIILCLSIICSGTVFSQRYSGHNFSGFSGVYGIQENPASFATKRPKWDVNLVGLSLYGYTEYGFIADQSVLSIQGMSVINVTDSIPRNIDDTKEARFFANQ